MSEYFTTSTYTKLYNIPKTKIAQNHKNICILQTKALQISNLQLKFDKTSMFLLKKNPKQQTFIEEIPLSIPLKETCTHKNAVSLNESSDIIKQTKKNGLLEKISEILQKNKNQETIHHKVLKRIKPKIRFPTVEKEKNKLITLNSLNVRRLEPLNVNNHFFTSKNKGKSFDFQVKTTKNQILQEITKNEKMSETLNFVKNNEIINNSEYFQINNENNIKNQIPTKNKENALQFHDDILNKIADSDKKDETENLLKKTFFSEKRPVFNKKIRNKNTIQINSNMNDPTKYRQIAPFKGLREDTVEQEEDFINYVRNSKLLP